MPRNYDAAVWAYLKGFVNTQADPQKATVFLYMGVSHSWSKGPWGSLTEDMGYLLWTL